MIKVTVRASRVAVILPLAGLGRRRTSIPRVRCPPGAAGYALERGDFLLDGPRGPGVHRDHPALFVMSGESFNLDTQEDAAQEGGAQAPQQRGSLKPSILAPTWLARFETPSAHGRGGVPSSLTLFPRRAYTFSGFRPFEAPEKFRSVRGHAPVW